MPAVVVVTKVFANLAQTAGRARGYDRLRMLVLPHPMETRSAAEIRGIAEERADRIRELLSSSSPRQRGDGRETGNQNAGR